jgi:hypothetical protein
MATVLRLRFDGVASIPPEEAPEEAGRRCLRSSTSLVTREAIRRRNLIVVAGCLENDIED